MSIDAGELNTMFVFFAFYLARGCRPGLRCDSTARRAGRTQGDHRVTCQKPEWGEGIQAGY